MRRLKKDHDKPIPIGDLQAIAKFRAELQLYAKVRAEGYSHWAAQMAVWGDKENAQ